MNSFIATRIAIVIPTLEFFFVTVDLRNDPDVLARVLEEFDPSGTQEIFPGQVGLRWIA